MSSSKADACNNLSEFHNNNYNISNDIYNNNNHKDENLCTDDKNISILDKLITSLNHNTNELNNNYFKKEKKISPSSNHKFYHKSSKSCIKDKNPNLSDVIADLTEFDMNEQIKRESLINKIQNGTIRRLTSESENSASISPSFSEKSNGVSWSDQVKEYVANLY